MLQETTNVVFVVLANKEPIIVGNLSLTEKIVVGAALTRSDAEQLINDLVERDKKCLSRQQEIDKFIREWKTTNPPPTSLEYLPRPKFPAYHKKITQQMRDSRIEIEQENDRIACINRKWWHEWTCSFDDAVQQFVCTLGETIPGYNADHYEISPCNFFK